MRKILSLAFLLLGLSKTYAQVSSCTYSGMLISSGTAGPIGDDASSSITLPFSFDFYGSTYTSAVISTNGFIWLGTSTTSDGCCDGYNIPTDASITAPYIALTHTDWVVSSGQLYYAVTGTSPNRVFVIHYANIESFSGGDFMTGEIQLYETSNEVRLVLSSLSGFGGNGTMGIAAGDGLSGVAVSGRNEASSYSATTECYSLSSSSTSLPVNMQSFEVQKRANTAILSWETAIEQNNDYFLIERSSNGIDYSPLARIYSKGNTSFGAQYSFTDMRPASGRNIYRLSQVDMDKRQTYIGARSLEFSAAATFSVEPNPFSDQLIIRLGSEKRDGLILSVVDIHGKQLAKLEPPGDERTTDVQLDTRNWAPGIYFLNISYDGQLVEHFKLVK